MAGKRKSRQRIIAIMQYLREFGEDGQKIDIAHLQDYLQELSSNRQIIYNDLKALEELGAGIEHNKNGHYIYKPQSFSSGELMLLADVICSSSFLSAKKAEELITHIKQMTNMKGFDDLSHDIDVVLRNKTINEECIKNIECIHKAIREKKKLTFKEFLKNYIPAQKGDIVDIETNRVLGKHEGAMYYTIGQRKRCRFQGNPHL